MLYSEPEICNTYHDFFDTYGRDHHNNRGLAVWKKQTMCTLLISVCKGGMYGKMWRSHFPIFHIGLGEFKRNLMQIKSALVYSRSMVYCHTTILLLLLNIHSTYLVWFQMFKHIWWDEVFEKLLGVLRARVVIII